MKQYKLLLADDSVTIQKVVNLTFADEGIEVISADNGDTALELFHERTPDLVMIDVNMPGLDGYDLCEYIKTNELSQHIPVILLVGSFEPFNQTRASQAKADDYMTKPFQSIRELVSKVTDLLTAKNDSPEVNVEHSSSSEMDTIELSNENLVAVEESAPHSSEEIMYNVGHPLDETAKYEFHHSVGEALPETENDFYVARAEDDLQIVTSSTNPDFQESLTNSNEYLFDFDDSDFLELPPMAKSDEKQGTSEIEQKSEETEYLPESTDVSPAEPALETEASYQTENHTESKSENEFDYQSQDEPAQTFDEQFFDEKKSEFTAVSEESLTDVAVHSEFQQDFKQLPEEDTSVEQVEEEVNTESVSDEQIYKELGLHNFSPEVIDAIAEKVVEKLSARMKE